MRRPRFTAPLARLLRAPLLLAALTPSLSLAQDSPAQEMDPAALGQRVVETTAQVQPGDVVVVYGSKHVIPLMEAVAIAAQEQGGMVTMFLASDRVERHFYKDMPEAYLEQEPAFFANWIEDVDVWIGLPSYADEEAVYAGVPEERLAKAARASQFMGDVLNEAKVALALVGYPTEAEAEQVRLDSATYARMHWAAVGADYDAIAEKGQALKRLLQEADSVRVTSPAGTDLTFALGDRPVFVDDGVVTVEERQSERFSDRFAALPGGQVYPAPIETSASGRVVVPRHRCDFEPLTGVSFTFEGGQLRDFEAGEGEACFEETMAPYSESASRFGIFAIGLNPALEVMEEEADYRPGDAAGMVTIGIGRNGLMGGANTEPGWFPFPITEATVEVDDKVVVRDGELVL